MNRRIGGVLGHSCKSPSLYDEVSPKFSKKGLHVYCQGGQKGSTFVVENFGVDYGRSVQSPSFRVSFTDLI